MSPAPPNTVEVFTRQNLFAKSVHAAFYGHPPLVLSPDVIWLTIAQGFANHVDQNAAGLRSKFVSHQGKKELEIERPEFVKGSPNNDWESVFPEFAQLIKNNTADGIPEMIQNEFSTTGPVERVVSHITLMDTVQHYFSYSMACGCGFPSITLTGTPQDWEKIRAKAERFHEFDLDWWLSGLLPALDQFVAASKGSPNLDFWRSLCNINTGTSFPVYEPLTGWVQVFFPYLNAINSSRGWDSQEETKNDKAKKHLRKNDAISNYVEGFQSKTNVKNFANTYKRSSRPWDQSPPSTTSTGVKLQHFPPGDV